MQYASSCVAYVGYAATATIPKRDANCNGFFGIHICIFKRCHYIFGTTVLKSVMQTAMVSFAFAMSMIVQNLQSTRGTDSNYRRN